MIGKYHWQFCFLQPQYASVTFYQINEKLDAREIIHKCVPELAKEDTIYEVGAKCVVKAKDDLKLLFSYFQKIKNLMDEFKELQEEFVEDQIFTFLN